MVLFAVLLCADQAAAQTFEVAGGYTVDRYDEIETTVIRWSATICRSHRCTEL